MARKLDPAVASLDAVLRERTAVADPALWEAQEQSRVRCHACGHRCVILPGLDGVCRVRFNEDGKLFVPRGYVGGLQVDPIEKKPFFHAFPGCDALSFGMLGCDLHCGYCQNWLTSQTLRDPAALSSARDIEADELVRLAQAHAAPVMVSTYNEPLITSEWAVEVFRAAREQGITCGYVSNGNATAEVLDYLRPWVDLYKVDLKSFRDRTYRSLGAKLSSVVETIERLVQKGFWVEVVTLVVPGFNDDEGELREMAGFLAGISRSMPWHVTAFHADYRMTEPRDTTVADLLRAAEIGRAAGLDFVYAGNLPGRVGDLEHTRCPHCSAIAIERHGYRVSRRGLDDAGRCNECGGSVPGFWSAHSAVPLRA